MHALEILALVGLVLLVFAATMRFAKGGDSEVGGTHEYDTHTLNLMNNE